MKYIIRGGIALGLVVMLWQFVFGFTGMYKNVQGAMMFPLVATMIEIVVLYYLLRATAAEGRGYFGQVSAGTLASFLGGALIIASAIFFLRLFPNYFNDIIAEYVRVLQGRSAAEVDSLLALQKPMQTPMWQATMGFLGTVITGLIVSLVMAIWIRGAKPAAPAAAAAPRD
jgi:hypothetical protein